MAESPQAELQKLIFEVLSTSPDLAPLVGGIYDRVPADPWKTKTAYISFGPADVVDDGADCIGSGVHTFQVDVWSKAVGQVEAKRIVDIAFKALHEQELNLADNALCEIRVDFRRVFPDSDPLITHGVLSVTAMIEDLD